MAVATYTKAGAKASTAATLPKEVFAVEIKNHQLVHLAYNAYLAQGRTNNAVTQSRGEVRGGGKKPWKQKGTGRARAGSIRSPLWKGGSVIFGPTGNENYTKKMSTSMKRQAVKQALSMANNDGSVSVVEKFEVKDGKTQTAAKLLEKLGASRRTLVVVAEKSPEAIRSTNNLPKVKLVGAKYLNTYDVLNAHSIIIEKPAIEIITEWLSGGKK